MSSNQNPYNNYGGDMYGHYPDEMSMRQGQGSSSSSRGLHHGGNYPRANNPPQPMYNYYNNTGHPMNTSMYRSGPPPQLQHQKSGYGYNQTFSPNSTEMIQPRQPPPDWTSVPPPPPQSTSSPIWGVPPPVPVPSPIINSSHNNNYYSTISNNDMGQQQHNPWHMANTQNPSQLMTHSTMIAPVPKPEPLSPEPLPTSSSVDTDKKKIKTENSSQQEEDPTGGSTKKPVLIMVGKRRGGRVLPTGIVKKPRTGQATQGRTDAWGQYMAEVRKYKEQSCEEERKNRPLVK